MSKGIYKKYTFDKKSPIPKTSAWRLKTKSNILQKQSRLQPVSLNFNDVIIFLSL